MPAALPDWWPESAGPLVYLTFGSVAGSLSFFPGLYRAAIDALADLPIRVLVTIGEAGDPAQLGPLPANVHVERWVSQADVARHAAAVVCHGGYGTTLGALVHGLPLVVVPLFAGDQWHNARRVAQLGAGIALRENADRRGIFDDPGPAVVAAIRDAVRSVLDDPGYRRAARNIAGAIDDLPPVDAAVDLFAVDCKPKVDGCYACGGFLTLPSIEQGLWCAITAKEGFRMGQHMSGDHRLERLRELVGRLEQLPGSDERDRVLREVRARAVDLDTGVAPRAMLTVDPTGDVGGGRPEPRATHTIPLPEPVKVSRVAARKDCPPAPQRWSRPVLRAPVTDSIDLLAAGEQLCLEELPALHGETAGVPGRRPWARGLRG